jgi:hypothetical protein
MKRYYLYNKKHNYLQYRGENNWRNLSQKHQVHTDIIPFRSYEDAKHIAIKLFGNSDDYIILTEDELIPYIL